MSTQTIYTRDRSSGRVHEQVEVDGRRKSAEGCNLDAAGESEVLDSIEGVEPGDLCARCFPQDAA